LEALISGCTGLPINPALGDPGVRHNNMRSKLLKILLVSTFVLFLLYALAIAGDDIIVIMEKPVKVTAKDIDGKEPNQYQLELSIEYGGDCFKFSTNMIHTSTFQEAIESQRTFTRWKGPYLLVGWERGGGNAERGYLDTVFMLKKGKLLYLGEVDAGSFEKGVFKDWFNKFEGTDITSHANAPVISLVVEEKGERLVANLDKTWNENQKRFNENRAIIKDILTNKNMNSESRITWLSGPLLFNAVLGKYCKRQADMDSFLKLAGKNLDRKSLKIFKDILAGVVPGALPQTAVEVIKY